VAGRGMEGQEKDGKKEEGGDGQGRERAPETAFSR